MAATELSRECCLISDFLCGVLGEQNQRSSQSMQREQLEFARYYLKVETQDASI
jgi:hypothetical protein